jgi:hypothetical protein
MNNYPGVNLLPLQRQYSALKTRDYYSRLGRAAGKPTSWLESVTSASSNFENAPNNSKNMVRSNTYNSLPQSNNMGVYSSTYEK